MDNGLLGGFFGGGNSQQPMNITPHGPLWGAGMHSPMMGGTFNRPPWAFGNGIGMGMFGQGGIGGMMPPGLMQKLQGRLNPTIFNALSGLGQNAQSPMTAFGLGMMGGGGWSGGIDNAQNALKAQKDQQDKEALKRILLAQKGGLGGGGVGPAPASIY